MDTKICFKCAEAKPRHEFYQHPMMGDGLLGKCKDCTKADVRAHRLANIERVRAYDRGRASLPHRAELRRRIGKEQRIKHPDRNAVRLKAYRAFPAAPKNCEQCGVKSSRIERHHLDYSQPLLIQWLCKPCHAAADKLRRQTEAA